MDKLAEEISKKADEYAELAIIEYPKEIKEGMSLHFARGMMAGINYHEAKMKEITDADIEAAAKEYSKIFKHTEFGFYAGAKAVLNNEIKHIEK